MNSTPTKLLKILRNFYAMPVDVQLSMRNCLARSIRLLSVRLLCKVSAVNCQ